MKKLLLIGALALGLGACTHINGRPQLRVLNGVSTHYRTPVVAKKTPRIVQPALPVPTAASAKPHKLTFKERWGTFKHKHPRWFR